MTLTEHTETDATSGRARSVHRLDPEPADEISPAELEDLCRQLMAAGRYAEQRCGAKAALSFFASAAIAEGLARGELR